MTEQPPSKDLSLELRSALRGARWYVEQYEPKDVSEAHDRDLLLTSIEALGHGGATEPYYAALNRLTVAMGNPALSWKDGETIESALIDEATRRLSAPEPAVTLTWDKFWQRVRESNWNPSPDDMRKILDGKIEHGASSDIPPCQAAEHGWPIMTLAECIEAEGGIPFQAMEASTEHEPKSDRCNALWLGCQLPPGHDGNHRCGAAVWSSSQPPVTPPCAIPFAGNSKGVNYEALANATYPERMYGDDEPEGEDRIKCPTCGQGHVDAAARTLRARLAQPPRDGG